MPAEKIEALASYATSPLFSERERLVLHYADQLTKTPVEVSEALFQQLQSHFSDEELVELTAAIAWENYRARFNHAFGAESEGFSEGTHCTLPAESHA
jgi:alkylhydroperoxidase family enzyme